MRRRPHFPRANHHLRRLLDAHRVQHDLLITCATVQFRPANAQQLRTFAAAKCRHARPLGISTAVAAGGGPVGDQAREVLDDRRLEGG